MGNYRHAPERTQPTPIRPRCLDALDEAALRVLSTKLLEEFKGRTEPVEPGTGDQFVAAEQLGAVGPPARRPGGGR